MQRWEMSGKDRTVFVLFVFVFSFSSSPSTSNLLLMGQNVSGIMA